MREITTTHFLDILKQNAKANYCFLYGVIILFAILLSIGNVLLKLYTVKETIDVAIGYRDTLATLG